jgi:holo-[acyl-carrier protein] synthase
MRSDDRGLSGALIKIAFPAADNKASMSTGLGIDLTSTNEVREAIVRFGDRYLERVYTSGELRDCGGDPARLAARFAAKEATNKALMVRDRLPWRTVEIRHSPSGAPSLILSGAARTLARERGYQRFAVSLTHERDYAAAVVIAEGEK